MIEHYVYLEPRKISFQQGVDQLQEELVFY